MVPCSFEQSNEVLDRPRGMEECDALSVFRYKTETGYPVVLSCWKLTKEEVDELLKTGRLWAYIYGDTMPPIALTTQNPWEQDEIQAGA